ncbi:hypothetical protein [Saccharolobus sp.]|uniref:hypothetical protein n=1 Tax=Saccharolobus sp. TaxID=2100761 RepID=UPI00316131F2
MNNKLHISVGVTISLVIALFDLRGILFKPGIVEAIDIQWNVNKIVWPKMFYLWNPQISGYNLYYLPQFHIYLLPLITDIELAQKLTYFFIIFTLCYSSFITAYKILLKYKLKLASQLIGSITATVLYSMSLILFNEFFSHILSYFTFNFSINIPLFVHLTRA